MSIWWPDRESDWHELDPSAWCSRLSDLLVGFNMMFKKPEQFTNSYFRAALYTNNRYVNMNHGDRATRPLLTI